MEKWNGFSTNPWFFRPNQSRGTDIQLLRLLLFLSRVKYHRLCMQDEDFLTWTNDTRVDCLFIPSHGSSLWLEKINCTNWSYDFMIACHAATTIATKKYSFKKKAAINNWNSPLGSVLFRVCLQKLEGKKKIRNNQHEWQRRRAQLFG